MKLFYSPGACSLSPHIVLRETGLPFELIQANLKNKTLADGSDFKAVNPKGYVPALVLNDGTLITEGPAIVQYLADQVPEKKLAPPNGTIQRVRLQEWLNFISTELHKSFSPLFGWPINDEAKGLFKQRLMLRLAVVDEHLAKNDYLLGEAFSVADAYLFVVTNWPPMVGVDISGFKHLAAFRERVGARPSVMAALEAEGLLKKA